MQNELLDAIGKIESALATLKKVATMGEKEPVWEIVPNFKKKEFACKCGCGFDSINPDVVLGVQEIRTALGAPGIVSSGCRCKTHNARVGGVANSHHLTGHAVDIAFQGYTANQVLAQAPGCFTEKYAIDESYVHLAIE